MRVAHLRILMVCYAISLSVALLFCHLQALYVWQSASYDTLLYARSLWGIAHGHHFNPVYGTHWLAIHANLLHVPLAFLTLRFEPATIVAVQHTLACFATLVIVARQLTLPCVEHSSQTTPPAALRDFSRLVALSLGSILFVGPFSFDPRPDVWGVPLLLVLFLRLARRSHWGLVETLLAASAVLVREEFAFVLCGAALIPRLDSRARTRAALAGLIALGWFATYWSLVRPHLDLQFAVARADEATLALFGIGGAEAWLYRLVVVAALLTMDGARLIRHWRWFLVAAPGLLWLLTIDKGGLDALRYHYAVFALPALLAGCLQAKSGNSTSAEEKPDSRKLATAEPRRAAHPRPGVRTLLTTLQAAFVVLWLLPRAASGYWLPPSPAEASSIQQARQMLASIEPDAGLAGPYMILAGEADRQWVFSHETLYTALRRDGQVPPQVDYVALLGSERNTARFIVGSGFRLQAAPGPLILLSLDRQDATLDPAWLETSPDPSACDQPHTTLDPLGLRICEISRSNTGHLELVVQRFEIGSPSDHRLASPPFTLMLLAPGVETPLLILGGLVLPSQLPPGALVMARTEHPFPPEQAPLFVPVFATARR